MKISIAMATYNGEAHLQEQLDSFVSQTRQPDELVVTDDCSTDATRELLEAFAGTAPFEVIVHRNERNYGYCGNFNQALMLTSGDLVFLSDQDDVWFPEKIELMTQSAEDHPEALVLMNDALLTHGDLSETGLTKLGQIESAGFSEDSFVMGCCAAVRRDLLNLCLPIPEGFPAHDNWVVGIADGMRRKRVIPEVLQYYRRHGENQSNLSVNNTRKANRCSATFFEWEGRLGRFFRQPTTNDQSLHAIQIHQAFLQAGVQKAIEVAPCPYTGDLCRYLESVNRRLWHLERRQVVRSLPFPVRLREVIKAMREGVYVTSSGWKSALRDSFGR
jgi:glycosyltransferase involved in cell wall biosynthesis